MQSNTQNMVPRKHRRSSSDELFEKIREYIDTGQLLPNQRLIESELAQKLGTSRTPVHIAIKQLEILGYVTTLSGSMVVAEHSLSRIQSLYEVREALESKAIKLTCKLITEEQINKAGEHLAILIQASRNRDCELFVQSDRAFHEELCVACNNDQLSSLVKLFRYQYQDRRLARVYTARDWHSQITQHSRILETVRARNEIRAEKAVRRHLMATMKTALARL